MADGLVNSALGAQSTVIARHGCTKYVHGQTRAWYLLAYGNPVASRRGSHHIVRGTVATDNLQAIIEARAAPSGVRSLAEFLAALS